jgi:hypothetical protein
MLPITLSLPTDVAVKIVVLVVIVIVVDLDVATVPIAVAPVTAPSTPGRSTDGNPCSPHQSRPWHIARVGIRIIRIRRRSGSIHDLRIV